MLQKETNIIIADNSGAKVAKIIGIPGYSRIRYASLGQIVRVSIQKAIPRSAVKRHEVLNAVIVRVQKEHKRRDGSYIRFDDNAAIVIGNDGNMLGTRVFGPVARELRDAGYAKIASLAKEVW